MTITHKSIQRRATHPIIKALGVKTPLSAIQIWVKTHKINPAAISTREYEKIEENLIANHLAKVIAINSIYEHHKNDFDSEITIAKKIRNHYHNSKKKLDGRAIGGGRAIKIVLKDEIMKKLEKHKIETKIYHTDFLESLLEAYFEEFELIKNITL